MKKTILLLERLKRAALLVLLLCAAGMGESLAQDYHWDVNFDMYPNTMYITGVVQIDGVEQFSMDLEIGAFCGDECRGRERASDTYFAMLNHYFVFLSVHGNGGDQLTFRLYDHALGEELDVTCSNVTFEINGVLGDPGSPYVFDFEQLPPEITQTTGFSLGWNWWSTYVEQDGIDGLAMLESGLGSNGTVIKTQCDGYAIYLPNYGSWIGNLQSINNESTYMIRTESACSVEMTGYEAMPSEHPITLYPGWNWIGYPNGGAMSLADAFANIIPSNGDQVGSQSAFCQYTSTLGMWIGTLSTITPGMGLQYKSNNSEQITLTYPDATRGEGQQRDITDNNHWVPNMHLYDCNMIVTGIMTLDGMELQSDQYEVGAFVGDECRGSVKPIYVDALDQYVVFLTIAGGNDNNGDEVTFKLYDYENDAEFTMNETLSFEVNGIVGLPSDDAYEFEFSSIVDITCTVYPGEDAGTVTGTGSYTMGETCTLTATANEGYHFASWVLDDEVVSTAETYSFTVTEDADYVANFELNVYEITASANPEGATSYFYVDSPDNGYYWDYWEGSAISGVYGSYFAIEAIIDWEWYEMGYRFINWTKDGEVVSEDQWYEFTVTESAHYVANFERIVFDITVSAEPAEGGYVWVDGSVQLGEDCYLMAETNIGYAFENWTENGEVVSTDNPYVFTVTGDRELVAHFVLTPLSITATPNFDERGTVSGAGEYYLYDTVTLTATANEGHGFVHWMQGVYEVSAEPTYSFTVYGPGDLVAVFTAHEDDIIVFADLNVKDICVANWDTDGDFEITYDEAAAVTDLGNAFQSTEITTFDELQYFTGLTLIGINDFRNCSNLTSITFPETLTMIGAEAFRGCSALRGAITLPESLESVGGYAFYGCDEITTVNYNAINCAEVGNASQPAFYDCASLAHINIGENVQSIPNYAFKRCSTVEDISSAAVVPPTIGASTFATVSRSIPVHVPVGTAEAYRNAPYWEEFFNITDDYSPNQYTCHWSANPNQFESNMSVIGVIQIDGVEQATDALEIGAFCGDECRGSQLLAYYPQVDRYLVFLTLYGEAGDLLTFRLYDHELGEESVLGCTSYVTFEADGRLGTFGEPYPFNFTSIQVTTLPQGWTWWNGYVELGEGSLEQMEESLGENGSIIKSRNDGFVSYYDGEWYGSLNAIDNENTYLIQTAAPCVMGVAGEMATPTAHPITIGTGWNWIGYPNAKAMSVGTALSGIEAEDDDLLKSQEGFSVYVTDMGWVGSLHTLTPGMGLMYQSHNAADMTLVYPANARTEAQEANVTARNNHWVPTPTAYAHNMSVIAVVELDDEELQADRYELAAFANGECRGSAKLMYVEALGRHIAFLTVSGDEAAELRFSLYDSETGTVEMQSMASLQYETNAIVGSIGEPYVVRFRSVTGVDEWASSVNIFPNPVNRGEQFSLGLPAVETLRATSVQIVNALGQVVETLRATSVPASITAPKEAGVYTLRIAVEGKGTCHKKLVVR